MIEDRVIWQIAAGDANRNYANVCLDRGIILNGPGHYGSWPVARSAMENDCVSRKKISDVRRFCEDINTGDWAILRVGKERVYGVGQVISQCFWSDHLGDVDGWDLQYVRKVYWHRKFKEPIKLSGLKWGDTTQVVNSEELIEWLNSLELERIDPKEEFKGLADFTPFDELIPRINDEDIEEYLVDKGISVGRTNILTSRIAELSKLAAWYLRAETGKEAQLVQSEHEAVSHSVYPLLTSLGWTPQRIAVEWNHVDIALFGDMPRSNDSLVCVVEAKRRGLSCLSAKSQAESYINLHGTRNCVRLIVTDGLRYGVFIRDQNGDFPVNPTAYLNLNRPMKNYPIYQCEGAPAALYYMSAYYTRP